MFGVRLIVSDEQDVSVDEALSKSNMCKRKRDWSASKTVGAIEPNEDDSNEPPSPELIPFDAWDHAEATEACDDDAALAAQRNAVVARMRSNEKRVAPTDTPRWVRRLRFFKHESTQGARGFFVLVICAL